MIFPLRTLYLRTWHTFWRARNEDTSFLIPSIYLPSRYRRICQSSPKKCGNLLTRYSSSRPYHNTSHRGAHAFPRSLHKRYLLEYFLAVKLPIVHRLNVIFHGAVNMNEHSRFGKHPIILSSFNISSLQSNILSMSTYIYQNPTERAINFVKNKLFFQIPLFVWKYFREHLIAHCKRCLRH